MYPTLLEFGKIQLHAYGALLAISFFLGILLAARRAPARGVSPDLVFDSSLVIVLASIVGARFMYVVFHREEMESWIDVIAVWRGGLTMYGGVLAAMAAAYVYLRRRGVSFLRMADIMAPSLGLGLMLTRVGCFLNGCCYGKPTTSPLGVHFPSETFVGQLFHDSGVHPTQLYSSLTGLLILVLLLLYDRGSRRQGEVFALYLILDGLGRFCLDFFRYYEANAYIAGPLTISQVISLGLAFMGLLLWVRTRRLSAASDKPGVTPAALSSSR